MLSIWLAVRPSREAVSRSIVELGFQAALLLVGADVGDHRAVAQRLDELRREVVDLVGVIALQRILILRVGEAPAHADVLHRLQEEIDARHLRELAAHARDDPIGR